MYIILLYLIIGLNICNAFITDPKIFKDTILNKNSDENHGKLSNNHRTERGEKGNDVLDLLMELNDINESGETKDNHSELKVENRLPKFYPSNLAKNRILKEGEKGVVQSKKEEEQSNSNCHKGDNLFGGKRH